MNLPDHKEVVIDTVTFSNFIKVGRLDFVCELYRGSLYITESVAIELENGDMDLSCWIKDGRIKKAVFQYDPGIVQKLSANLGDGEISCIAYAVETGCTFATDDMAARRAARGISNSMGITGTVGLLAELVQADLITSQDAKELLKEMVREGVDFLIVEGFKSSELPKIVLKGIKGEAKERVALRMQHSEVSEEELDEIVNFILSLEDFKVRVK